MIAYIRLGLVLLALGLSAWGGWTARSWLQGSRDLRKVEAERDAAIQRERAAEAKAKEVEEARAQIASDLATEQAKTHETIKTVVKRVPKYIGGGDCALDVDGVRDLNEARGALVPDARRLVDDGPRTSRSDSP